MVGGHDKKDSVSKDTKDLLLTSGLMKSNSDTGETNITQEGFQFLLMDTNSQIWYFLLYHFELLKNTPEELIESLKFLLKLNFSIIGQDYPSTDLTPTIEKLLQNLRELGIVYQRKRSDNRYYPTPLAVSLICGSNLEDNKNETMKPLLKVTKNENIISAPSSALSSTLNTHDKRMGHIIVETNFRLYAYSESELQIQLLALFCDMQYRFPKFSIGIITRDSVRQALKCGITANQIIHYLQVHTHPVTLKNPNPVPMNVCDQIMLWELEKCRFKFTESYLYNQFATRTDFDTVHAYAQEIFALKWGNRNKRVLVISKEGHEDIKKFWKNQKNNMPDIS